MEMITKREAIKKSKEILNMGVIGPHSVIEMVAEKKTVVGAKIFTYVTAPFLFGGTHLVVATVVKEYERVDLGKEFYGILVKNPNGKFWHMADEVSGGLVGSGAIKSKLIATVKADVAAGEVKTMKQQQEHFTEVAKGAKVVSNEEWFKQFKGVR